MRIGRPKSLDVPVMLGVRVSVADADLIHNHARAVKLTASDILRVCLTKYLSDLRKLKKRRAGNGVTVSTRER